MTVILDLDHTLLRTSSLKGAMMEHLAPLGITPEQFKDTYDATVHAIPGQYSYDIARHALLIEEKTGVDAASAGKALFAALDTLPSMLYDDAVPFLNFLRSRKLPMVLLTMGNAAFQRAKVERLDIEQYFDDCIYTETGKETIDLEFSNPPSEWLFINDNPKELRALAARFPESAMIRIKRPDGKMFTPEDDALNVPTFSSLTEVENLLLERK